ncbi:MAG: serine phosphatase RsbU (regulator of sigma subunit) [Hyphomicrobiaceae bacterium]|jgi:serine phosphatase RsbU (regulator of sigma subunit)
MPCAFSNDLLPKNIDAADTLYVTDLKGNIVYANNEWATFADANNGHKLLETDWNDNLLSNLCGKQRDRWEHIYRLLRQGRLPHHQEQMNCSSPTERRIYQLRVTPKKDDQGEIAWFIHHNVRIDNKAEALEQIAHQLDELGHSDALAEEFQTRIVDRLIQIPSFEVARHFEPLEEIGGDLVWHREYPDATSDLILADVMGHGAGAGLVATKIAAMLDEITSVQMSPRETVKALNGALLRIVPSDQVMFATGLCLRFEPNQQRVTCCDFGHEDPIFSRSGPISMCGGLPVGLIERDEPWGETNLELSEHGSRFLVFSDGITEQFNSNGEMFGVTGLVEAFQRAIDEPVDEMVRKIIEELRSFRGSAQVKDDQTLLALHFSGNQ